MICSASSKKVFMPNNCLFNFDLNAISNRSKKGETIEMYLKNKGSVDAYLHIMESIAPVNALFQKDYIVFYRLRLSTPQTNNYFKVFDDYYKKSKTLSYANILTDLCNSSTGTGRIETSFGSKMLHTLKPDEPIIDSEVVNKLRYTFCTASYFKGVPKNINSINDAIVLHNALKDCYLNCLIPAAKKVGYFNRFDQAFTNATGISEVKKIDFYLWSM